MIELRHMDVRHFVIIVCSHLANGRTIKCGYIGLMIFRYYIMPGRNNMRYKY